jgi:hypothetical protein
MNIFIVLQPKYINILRNFCHKFLWHIESDSVLSSLIKYHILNCSRSVDDFLIFEDENMAEIRVTYVLNLM